MTIFKHAVPANMVGVSVPAVSSAIGSGTFVVQDVENAIYAMVSGSPVKVGFQAVTSDGASGIQQLARGLDASYNSVSSTTGYGASGNSSSVTVQYPSTQILWNGSMQPITAGSWTGTPPGTGLYSFCVTYQWGLSSFALTQANFNNYIEICAVNITSTSATVQGARTTSNYMGQYWISSVQTESRSNGIPYSDANGNMSW